MGKAFDPMASRIEYSANSELGRQIAGWAIVSITQPSTLSYLTKNASIPFATAQFSLALGRSNFHLLCHSILVCRPDLAGATKNGIRGCPGYGINGICNSPGHLDAGWGCGERSLPSQHRRGHCNRRQYSADGFLNPDFTDQRLQPLRHHLNFQGYLASQKLFYIQPRWLYCLVSSANLA